MVFDSLLVAAITGAVVSVVSAAVLLLLGGYGGHIRANKRINAVEDEIDRVEKKLTRETKARAARTPSWREQAEAALHSNPPAPAPKSRADIRNMAKNKGA